MSKPIPPVQKYMTTTPQVLSMEASVKDAHELMHRLQIRHLPVCDGPRCVGMLSDSDLFKAEALFAADPATLKAKNVMATNLYSVSPHSPVDEVVDEMAKKKFGSAVVIDNGKVVGVFTATDALSAFAELLQTRLRH